MFRWTTDRFFGLLNATMIATILVLGAEPSAAQFGGVGGLPTPMPIDVETAEVDGDYLRNGAVFAPNVLDGGMIRVQSAQGDATILGGSWSQSYGPLHLVKGEYTPYFSSVFSPPTAPRASIKAFAPPTDLQADGTWNLDVPAVRVQFSFLMNGVSFPGSVGEIADFYLRDVESGRDVAIGTSADASSTRYIVPGTYDVIYAHREGRLIPQNENTRILEAVEISEATRILVDVPMVGRSFFYFLDGVPFPMNDIYTSANIYLENVEAGDSFYLGSTTSPDYVRLIPGTYQVRYEFREGWGVLPANPNAIVDEALVVAPSGSTTVNIHVASHVVDPQFEINGSSPPSGLYEYGEIYLARPDGDRFKIGDTRTDPDPIRVVAGSYDAYYVFREGGDVAPRNPDSRFASGLEVDADGPLVLDVETAILTLDLELNGERFPYDVYETGRIRIVDPETGADIIAGRTMNAPFVLRLIPGRYDVVYEFREGGSEVPVNRHHVIARGLLLDNSQTQVINVETRRVSPGFALNGEAFPTYGGDYGEFFLRDPDGDMVPLGLSNVIPPDQTVIEGAYAVNYEWRAGDAVPFNTREVIQLVSVPEAGFAPGLLLCTLALWGCEGRGRSATRSDPTVA